MPRRSSPPKYARHSSGQARVRVDGKVIYLGPYGSQESKDAYGRIVENWLRENESTYRDCPRLTVDKIAVAYVRHAKAYYVKNGRETSEVQAIRDALKHVLAVAGKEEASAFSPKRLKAVQARLVSQGLARTTINAAVRRVRRMFRWRSRKSWSAPPCCWDLKPSRICERGDPRHVNPIRCDRSRKPTSTPSSRWSVGRSAT